MKETHFGVYGGCYVAETLMPTLLRLGEVYDAAKQDPAFQAELDYYLRDYVGRESALYRADRLTEHAGGATIYLKREDLNHTGAHKVNNTVGQALLAKRMGKTRLIAETGAGMHGVATATVAARFGFSCDVFMGAEDIRRQAPNVDRMRVLGANVIAVESGTATLKDAMNEALRNWVATVEDTFYVIGTVAVPRPTRRWCATSSRSSAARPSASCASARGGSPTRSSPASAAAPTPWAFFTTSSTTRRWR